MSFSQDTQSGVWTSNDTLTGDAAQAINANAVVLKNLIDNGGGSG